MAAGQPIATVVAVIGKVEVRNPQGQIRALKPGDVLREGDTLITAEGARAELAFGDGDHLTVEPSQTVGITPELSEVLRPDRSESEVANATIDKVIQALGRGGEIDALLEEPAAGGAGGGGGEGNSFVRLLRITEDVEGLSFAFPGNAQARPDNPFNGSGGVDVAATDTTTPNLPPEAKPDEATTPRDTPVVVPVLANDSDPNGDHLTITVVAAALGTVVVNPNGTVTYTPPVGYVGSDTITYTVSDGKGGTASATATVTVTAVEPPANTPPEAAHDAVGTLGGTPLIIAVRGNDSDPDGDALTVTGVTQGANGVVVIDAITGNPIYTPNPGYAGSDTFSYTVSDGHGGTSTATVTVTVTAVEPPPPPDATTVTLSAAASVVEGGSLIYTATVSNAVTGSDLVVQLSNGQSITIPVGQTHADSAPVAVRGDDAYVQGTGTVTVGISGTSGGNFEALNTASTASTTVTDDADATTVTLSAAASVVEGGSLIYTATVSNAVTGSDLVVQLSNGQSITIPVGQTHADSAPVAVRGDDAYVQGTGTVTVGISGTSGGNFEALNTASTASTTVTDDADATTVTLSAAASVVEGGSLIYTATVSNAVTGSDLVVQLSNGQSITIPVGQTHADSAPVAVRGDDAYVQGTGTVTVGISGTSGGNFEALNTASTASTTVTDDADATTVTLSAAASVVEGGSLIYTATVSNAVTGSDLVVQLSNGQSITIPVGQTHADSAPVAVRGDDAYVQGTGTVTVGISGTSGGNFEALNTASTASTTVTDDADATTVTLSAAASVVEGGSLIYTATVSNAVTGSDLVVQLSNGQSITIPVGQTHADSAPVAVRGDDAYVQGTGTVTVGISGTSGGNFEALNTASTASTTVTDDADATTVTLSAAASVVEGGSLIYTATVSNAVTGSDLVVQLSNGQSITIPVGQTHADSAPVAVRGDDAYVQGTGTVTVGISGTSGGNFEALNTASTASTTVTDDADATTVTLSAAASVVEGGSLIYTATVSNAVTGSDLVVQLSNGQSITIPVGQTHADSAPVAVRGDDAYVQGTGTVTVGISGTSGGNFEALNTASTASTTVTDDADATTVTLSAAASVVEGGSLIYTATVSNAVTGSDLVVQLSNGQSITIPVGQTHADSAPVAVRGDDAYVQGTGTVTVGISGTSGGNFEALNTASTASTTVTDDADATTVTLSAAASVVEGGSLIYTATVSNAVTGSDLVVQLSNGQSITIPVGQTHADSAPVAVRGDDAYVQGTGTVTVGISGTSGGNFEALNTASTASTTVTDDADATTVTLSAAASVVEGGSLIYTATVSNAVTGSDLVVQLSNGQSITIPVGQTHADSAPVAVRGDDAYVQGTGTVTVGISGTSGGNFEALNTASTASTTVTDDADATTVTLSAAASVVEGGSLIYTATVSNAVTGSDLVVQLSNGQSITIPVGQTHADSAPVAVRGDDAYVQGTGTVTVGISGTSGGNFEALNTASTASTTVTDDADATTVTLSAAASVVEGGSLIYTATVSNAVTGSDLVVQLSNGQSITIPVGQTHADSAPVAVRGDDAYVQGTGTVTVGISGTSGGNFEALNTASTASTTVTDDADATTVTLSATSAVGEGGTITYTATLSNPAETATTITLNNGLVIAIGAGGTTGSGTFALPANQEVSVPTPYVVGIASTTGGNFEAINTASTATTTINPVNDAPDAVNDSYTTAEGTPLTVNALSGVLANDSDLDGDSLTVTSFTQPAHGTVAIGADGNLTYTPNANFNGTETLTYTVSDGHGGTDTATVNITVTAANQPPVVGSATARVSEEGLTGANPDTAGTSDTTNSKTASGTLAISDGDSPQLAVTLGAPAGTYTSGGQALVWSGAGTGTLLGKVGSTTIVTVTIDNAGHYSVTLNGPLDHAAGGGENQLAMNFGVSVSDGINPAVAGSLSVVVEDDSPVIGTPDLAVVQDDAGAVVQGDLNLSIGADSGLAKVVFAGTQVDANGFIQGNLYDSSGAQVGTNAFLTYNGSKLHYVSGADGSLTAVDGSGTEVFKLAGNAATGEYTATMLHSLDPASLNSSGTFVAVTAGNTGNYIVSDPNNYFTITATATGGATPTVNTNQGWFGANNNWVDTGETLHFSFASGGTTTPTGMNGISFTVQALGSGESLTWTTYDAQGQVLDQGTVAGAGNGGNVADITTTLGAGQLTHGEFYSISFGASGATTSYRMSLSAVSGHSEVLDQRTSFSVTGVDGDGDSSSSASMNLSFNAGGAITGTGGADALGGDNLANTLIGGAGSDDMLGGLGSDTFKWSLGDAGTGAAPAVDRIGDFNTSAASSGGDVLDLRDLLQNEAHTGGNVGNLGSYLHFEASGSDTVVHVSTNGAFSSGYVAGTEQQTIVLEGVNLLAGGLNDQQVIQNLLNQGKLVTD